MLSTAKTFLLLEFVFLCTEALVPPKYSTCVGKDFGHGSVVCVCSEQYCDSFSEGKELPSEEYAVYTSSKTGDRFKLTTGTFDKTKRRRPSGFFENGMKLSVNRSTSFQTILGFGGAFTGIVSKHVLYARGYKPQSMPNRIIVGLLHMPGEHSLH